MALQNLIGAGIWVPTLPEGFTDNSFSGTDIAIDADEEELQHIGRVRLASGTSKTFGTSGSGIGWLVGSAITFQAVATVTVGVKKAASIDAATGPPARATIGAAAFDVYIPLVGGVDTITATTWRTDSMTLGTPFTVTDGDLIAVCFHMDITSAAQAVKVRTGNIVVPPPALTATTLVTSGPAYTNSQVTPNVILIFDDGTIGWLENSFISSVSGYTATSGTIGNTNIQANIFRVPFSCKVDAIAVYVGGSGDLALDLYSTPLGTPGQMVTVAFDGNIKGGSSRLHIGRFAPQTLTINTDYAAGIRQTSATAVSSLRVEVAVDTHWKPWGMAGECYAAVSTAGGTFAAVSSTLVRHMIAVRICALDDGVQVGGGGGRPELRMANL